MTDTLWRSANVCKGRPFTIAALSGLGDMGPKVAVPLTMPFQNLEAAFAGLGGPWACWLMAIEACSTAVRSSKFWGKRQGSPIDDEQAVGRHMRAQRGYEILPRCFVAVRTGEHGMLQLLGHVSDLLSFGLRGNIKGAQGDADY